MAVNHDRQPDGGDPGVAAGVKNKVLGELDWDGAVVWQWGDAAPGGGAQQHHDWSRLPNGDTLVLSALSHSIPGFVLPVQLDDAIYEVTPNGDIAWKWLAGDHLDEFGFTPEALELVRKSDHPDYLIRLPCRARMACARLSEEGCSIVRVLWTGTKRTKSATYPSNSRKE